MIIIEFILKDELKSQALEQLCTTLYNVGGKIMRKADNATGSPVFAISRSSDGWMRLLIDDNTPPEVLRQIENQINALQKKPFIEYTAEGHTAPPPRKLIGED